jgi:hypothetical protein
LRHQIGIVGHEVSFEFNMKLGALCID